MNNYVQAIMRLEFLFSTMTLDKRKYDEVLFYFEKLLNQRDALRRDNLVNAIMKNSRTYEEIIRFINTN